MKNAVLPAKRGEMRKNMSNEIKVADCVQEFFGATAPKSQVEIFNASAFCSAGVVTGDESKSLVEGVWGVAVSTGDDSNSSSKGIRGVSVTTGYESASESYGEKSISVGNAYRNAVSAMAAESIAVAWGPGSKAKGIIGTYLVLSEWEYTGKWYDLEYESATVWADKWKLVGQKFVLVDGTSIKADTWYHLVSGEVKEVKEDDKEVKINEN